MEEKCENWQNQCLTLRTKMRYILKTEVLSDCTFVVGEKEKKRFCAHKLILSMSSPVFEKMFFGNFTNKDEPILIPDITPNIFCIILVYIYTDNINIDSVQMACETLYATEKYILKNATQKCIDYINNSLTTTNVLKIYEVSEFFNLKDLKRTCLEMISCQTKEILCSENFMDLKISSVVEIFSLKKLQIDSELDLFNALKKYAEKNHLINFDLTAKESSMRRNDIFSLKEALYKIRFLTLTPQEFVTVVKSKIFKNSEALAIFTFISSGNKSSKDLNSVPKEISKLTISRSR